MTAPDLRESLLTVLRAATEIPCVIQEDGRVQSKAADVIDLLLPAVMAWHRAQPAGSRHVAVKALRRKVAEYCSGMHPAGTPAVALDLSGFADAIESGEVQL